MKTVEELYSEMAADFAERTGMEITGGGDLAARLYATAAQIYALYVQADWVNRQCFPQTAQGEYLDYHAQLRALERKEAVCAQGVVRFFGDTASVLGRNIPAGTVCMTAGLVRFVTTEDRVLEAGKSSVDAPVRAVQAGKVGNVVAGAVRSLAAAPVGITGCTNPMAISGGMDAEDDESLRERIMNSFLRLPNGSNCAFYEQGALSFDEVVAAVALPRSRGVGTVDVVIAAAQGLPEQSLLDRVSRYFRERREIAVDVQTLAPEPVTIDVVVQIQSADLEQSSAKVKQVLQDWFSGQRLGEDVLRARLGNLVFDVDGVENYVLKEPATDRSMERTQLPVLGTVTVEEME